MDPAQNEAVSRPGLKGPPQGAFSLTETSRTSWSQQGCLHPAWACCIDRGGQSSTSKRGIVVRTPKPYQACVGDTTCGHLPSSQSQGTFPARLDHQVPKSFPGARSLGSRRAQLPSGVHVQPGVQHTSLGPPRRPRGVLPGSQAPLPCGNQNPRCRQQRRWAGSPGSPSALHTLQGLGSRVSGRPRPTSSGPQASGRQYGVWPSGLRRGQRHSPLGFPPPRPHPRRPEPEHSNGQARELGQHLGARETGTGWSRAPPSPTLQPIPFITWPRRAPSNGEALVTLWVNPVARRPGRSLGEESILAVALSAHGHARTPSSVPLARGTHCTRKGTVGEERSGQYCPGRGGGRQWGHGGGSGSQGQLGGHLLGPGHYLQALGTPEQGWPVPPGTAGVHDWAP